MPPPIEWRRRAIQANGGSYFPTSKRSPKREEAFVPALATKHMPPSTTPTSRRQTGIQALADRIPSCPSTDKRSLT